VAPLTPEKASTVATTGVAEVAAAPLSVTVTVSVPDGALRISKSCALPVVLLHVIDTPPDDKSVAEFPVPTVTLVVLLATQSSTVITTKSFVSARVNEQVPEVKVLKETVQLPSVPIVA
jgi:hypothetical protein